MAVLEEEEEAPALLDSAWPWPGFCGLLPPPRSGLIPRRRGASIGERSGSFALGGSS